MVQRPAMSLALFVAITLVGPVASSAAANPGESHALGVIRSPYLAPGAPAPTTQSTNVAAAARDSVAFSVLFEESGLPSGTAWWVIFDGIQRAGTTAAIEFNVTNGTHSYLVATGNAWRWWPAPCNGSVVVAGASATVPIRWDSLFELKFDESTLPPGTNWSVTVAGAALQYIFPEISTSESNAVTAWSEGNESVSFYVGNGTYDYAASAPGYVSTTAGTIAILGGDRAMNVSFEPAVSTSSPLTSRTTLALIGAGLVVGAMAALLLQRRRGVRQ